MVARTITISDPAISLYVLGVEIATESHS